MTPHQGTRHVHLQREACEALPSASSAFASQNIHPSWFYEPGLSPRAGYMCWEGPLDFYWKTNILFLLVIGTKLYRFVQWEVYPFPCASIAKPSMRHLHHSCCTTTPSCCRHSRAFHELNISSHSGFWGRRSLIKQVSCVFRSVLGHSFNCRILGGLLRKLSIWSFWF